MTPEEGTVPLSSDNDLQHRRDALRQGLRRTNLASLFILGIVVALAGGFVWKARQSSQQAERASDQAARASLSARQARSATARAEAELWNSRLNEARARRIAGGPGARVESGALLRELVGRPDLTESQRLALRQEAIAQLAIVDVAPATNWIEKRDHAALPWDGALTRYVRHPMSGTVEVREYPSGSVLATFRGTTRAAPHASVLTPDGLLLATRFYGGDVSVWNVRSQQIVLQTRCPNESELGNPLLVSPDGRALAMLTDSGLILQSLSDSGPARTLQTGRRLDNLAFTHDSTRIAVSPSDNRTRVEVWDVASGETLQNFDAGFPVWSLEWHPDGHRLALAGDHGRLGLWEIAPGKTARENLRCIGHVGALVYTMFTPDGSALISHSWDSISSIWDVVSGRRLLAETRFEFGGVSSDGRFVVARRERGRREAPCALLPRTGYRAVAWAGESRSLNGIWLSPDSRLLIAAYSVTHAQPRGECRLWDLERGVELARIPGIWAQLSPDGRSLFTFDFDTLKRYSLDQALITGEELPQPQTLLTARAPDYVNAGTVSADGQTLAVATGHQVVLVDLTGAAAPRRLPGLAHDAALSPDGQILATRFQNQPACLRNRVTGDLILQRPGVVRYDFSPDGRWIVAIAPEELSLLDRQTLSAVWETPLEIGAGAAPPTDFSPDSSMIAIAYNRFDVRLLETATGKPLATFSAPHPAQIGGSHGLAFSHDGRHLVIAKEDGEVVAWDLPVVQSELAKLGLDWASESAEFQSTQSQPLHDPFEPAGDDMRTHRIMAAGALGADASPIAVSSDPSTFAAAAFAAVACALAAGLFVLFYQRRMLAAYAHTEALALAQQEKLRTVQEALLHSQKMRALGTLAAGIAHDFNNLLSVIRLSNQLAAEQTHPSGTAKENVDAIESAVIQGETIVQSMLGYSRAAAELDNEYRVDAALNETVAMLGRKFLAGIILKLEIAPDLPVVRGSRGRLEQILLNLVVNASEAMDGQGTLRLTAGVIEHAGDCLLKPRAASAYVEVAVSDSGPGIPADILPRVFEPFFTTKHTSARNGTGLGLSTVYSMAQQDGLGLSVATNKGSGTTFRILVPVVSHNPAFDANSNSRRGWAQQSQCKRDHDPRH